MASIFSDDQKNELLYIVEGQWSDSYTFKKVGSQKEIKEFSTNTEPKTPLTVAPMEQQHPLESRRAWQYVATAIRKGDIFAVGHEKSKIENEQRKMREREKGNGTEFPRRYFTHVSEDLVAKRLTEGMKEEASIKREMNGHHGVWLWDEEKYRKINQ